MYFKQPLLTGLLASLLLLPAISSSAQCVPPAAFWSTFPQSSTALTINWTPVNGATKFQLRYWRTSAPDDKTIVEDFSTAPSLLSGLKKYTEYAIEIRTKCGGTSSAWASPITYFTPFTTASCNTPVGATISTGNTSFTLNWLSTGSHTVRYRLGITGDWTIPTGALAVTAQSYTISGLAPGTYQVELKRNCSATASNFLRFTRTITASCTVPAAPAVIPDVTSASVILPHALDVTAYNMSYRDGTSGPWTSVGTNIPASVAYLNPPLLPSSEYQVQIQAVCNSTTSAFSAPATFTTLALTPCLPDKNAGKYLSEADKLLIDNNLNTPSPYTLGSMIGVNDGGLFFRSFQNSASNQIVELTNQLRIFHTIDEDFNQSIGTYDQNIKPKDTSPEGTPGNTQRNKTLYELYHNTHEFSNITGAIELLQYGPLTWKDKIYRENDWSLAGFSGIKTSFENYTKKIIDEYAPAAGIASQQLMSTFQVGNELWDYPVEADYQALVYGARNAFINKYGPKSNGNWKMKLAVSAFQAFRDDNCNSLIRDISNCGSSLERHDFIGDYLNFTDCEVLKDLDVIDCHPYSFMPGTTSWTYPENPLSEAWQIRNLAAWKKANENSVTGVLYNTRLWASEYGYDSDKRKGVGERTQNAYLLRGLLLHSRYHFEKVFFYNAFDHFRKNDPNYGSLYGSSGFWRLGTEPSNSSWPSPLEANGASAKPAWFGMLDLKARFGEHVFYKALSEDSEAFVFLLAKADGSDPYLVFWSPAETNDVNIDDDISIQKTIDWSSILTGNYWMETATAQTFAESAVPGDMFSAATTIGCGVTTLNTIRRNPAFIHLVPCSNCPNIVSFKRSPHTDVSCNPSGDFDFEIQLQHVTVDDEITISGLPLNGLNHSVSSLNDVGFNAATFSSNLEFVNDNSFRWLVKANNGLSQKLNLHYCWVNNYPEPISATNARSDCSGITIPCIASAKRTEMEEGLVIRNAALPAGQTEAFSFSVQPNPGSDHALINYVGAASTRVTLCIFSATGQLLSTQYFEAKVPEAQWLVDTSTLTAGIYFFNLQTDQAVRHLIWEKY